MTEVTKISAPSQQLSRFSMGCRIFQTQLHDSSIPEKPEVPKSIRLTEPQMHLPKTTFQQQELSALQKRGRNQSPKHNFRNRLMECLNQITVSQTPHK